MGHKIHPTGIRLGITQEHRSKWYAPSKTYPLLLQEDDRIRTFIKKKYSSVGVSDVLIARKADQLEVELKTARPGVIVGRQGSGIEDLRSGIQKTIGDRSRQVRINVVEVERADGDAFLGRLHRHFPRRAAAAGQEVVRRRGGRCSFRGRPAHRPLLHHRPAAAISDCAT